MAISDGSGKFFRRHLHILPTLGIEPFIGNVLINDFGVN